MSALVFLFLLALPVVWLVAAIAFRGKASALRKVAESEVERAEAARTPPPLPKKGA